MWVLYNVSGRIIELFQFMNVKLTVSQFYVKCYARPVVIALMPHRSRNPSRFGLGVTPHFGLASGDEEFFSLAFIRRIKITLAIFRMNLADRNPIDDTKVDSLACRSA
jgi:hypothetical protein